MPARFGRVEREFGNIDPRNDRDPWRCVGTAVERRPREPKCDKREQEQAGRQQGQFVKTQPLPRSRLLPQPAQGGELGRALFVSP